MNLQVTTRTTNTFIYECRICSNTNLTDIISLGEQYITSRFPTYGDFSTLKTGIDLCLCSHCGLVQLKQIMDSSELYEYEYGYRSGISNTMRAHLLEYKTEICDKVAQLLPGDTIIDIGSNDSTMLQYYSGDYRRIGIDPTGTQFRQFYGDVELLPTYFNSANVKAAFGDTLNRVKIVSSISMFYDLPDPVQFAKDIHSILDDDGIWTCEQSYLLTMLRSNSIDTICHEHLEYYALHQIKEIADRAGFKIIDVKFNDCNGGSFRIYFAKQSSTKYTESTELVARILKEEREYGILNPQVYSDFMANCDTQIRYLTDFIQTANKNGKKAYIYGASTKGNCLLQYAQLGEDHMKYAVERNPQKIGKMTSTGIAIIGEETMRESPPDYLLVLPWHFRTEIVEREHAFLAGGGQLIFPFPRFEIVGNRPKALITGSNGMIAHYVKRELQSEYNLYGIARQLETHDPSITTFELDMTDTAKLEHTLSIVKPDVIIHLASISSSQYAFNNPVETLNNNGLLVAQLCDIIHRRGWNMKLFNASSSEMYKGHFDYEVQEDDHNMRHLHPYSIAKTMGHNMVEFYRTTYGLPFSNGVIFTTESPRKQPVFLLNKVARHIRELRAINNNNNNSVECLLVGNLDSWRNILHASDVATAIRTIIAQDYGETYLICNNQSHQIVDLVGRMYRMAGLDLDKKDNIMVDKSTGNPILHINSDNMSNESTPINIRGIATKIASLGWAPAVSIDEILAELL